MSIAVLVEPIPASGFRASCGQPLPLSAEASSRSEAVGLLRKKLTERLTNGVALIDLELPSAGERLREWTENRVQPDASTAAVFADWEQAVADHRDEMDENPAAL